jgi:uncharacterized alkaline shock family protein YloU
MIGWMVPANALTREISVHSETSIAISKAHCVEDLQYELVIKNVSKDIQKVVGQTLDELTSLTAKAVVRRCESSMDEGGMPST